MGIVAGALLVEFMNLSVMIQYYSVHTLANVIIQATHALIDRLAIAGGSANSNSMFSSAGGPGTIGPACLLLFHHFPAYTSLLAEIFN